MSRQGVSNCVCCNEVNTIKHDVANLKKLFSDGFKEEVVQNSTAVLSDTPLSNKNDNIVPYSLSSSSSSSDFSSNHENIGDLFREMEKRNTAIEKLQEGLAKFIESNFLLKEDREFLRDENAKHKNEIKLLRTQLNKERNTSQADNVSMVQTMNRFQSLRFTSNEPQQSECSPDEIGRTVEHQLAANNKTALLITTSMARDID